MRLYVMIFNGIIVIACSVAMLFANKQPVDLNLFVLTLTKPLGALIACCLLISYFLGIIAALFSRPDVTGLKSENEKLKKKVDELTRKIKKLEKEYAFQEKKVCFLEQTIQEETEEKPAPPPPPKDEVVRRWRWPLRWPYEKIILKKK